MTKLFRQVIRKATIWIFVGGGVFLSPQLAMGAEWSVVPSIQLKEEYEDNIHLTTMMHDTVWGSAVSPSVQLVRRAPASVAKVSARLRFNRYSGDDVRDTDVQYLTLSSRNRTPRGRWVVKGSFKRDTTLSTLEEAESDTADEEEAESDTSDEEELADAEDIDEGLVQVEVRRNRLDLDPSWSQNLTERMTLRLGYRLRDVYYSAAEGTSLFDYQRHSLDVALMRQVTERYRLGITARYSEYRASEVNSEADTSTLLASMDHAFSETLRGIVAVGMQNTSSMRGALEDESTGYTFDVGIKKKINHSTNYRLALKRDVQGSGAGRVVQSDRLNIHFSSKITSKLTFLLSGKFFRNKSLEASATNVDRRYYSIEPSLRWLLTRKWSVDGYYRYRYQKYDNAVTSAQSNAVFLGIRYAWPVIRVSR